VRQRQKRRDPPIRWQRVRGDGKQGDRSCGETLLAAGRKEVKSRLRKRRSRKKEKISKISFSGYAEGEKKGRRFEMISKMVTW